MLLSGIKVKVTGLIQALSVRDPADFVEAAAALCEFTRDVLLTQSHYFSLTQAEIDSITRELGRAADALDTNTPSARLNDEDQQLIHEYSKNIRERINDIRQRDSALSPAAH